MSKIRVAVLVTVLAAALVGCIPANGKHNPAQPGWYKISVAKGHKTCGGEMVLKDGLRVTFGAVVVPPHYNLPTVYLKAPSDVRTIRLNKGECEAAPKVGKVPAGGFVVDQSAWVAYERAVKKYGECTWQLPDMSAGGPDLCTKVPDDAIHVWRYR